MIQQVLVGFFQIQLHSQSQDKVFPHEKAQLKLNFDILQTRRQRYQQEQLKVNWNFHTKREVSRKFQLN